MSARIGAAVLAVAVVAYVLAFQQVVKTRGDQALYERGGSPLPLPVARILLGGFDGIASDWLFIETVAFVQGRVAHQKPPSAKDWEWVAGRLDRMTDLDPHFLDPYYFGQAFLTWSGGMIDETNTLLDKARRHRSEMWVFPFFIGFNHFYFLQQYGPASAYMMEASRKKGSPGYLAGLAARLAVRGNETQAAVDFLREAIPRTDDEGMKTMLSDRLEAFEHALRLEQAVAEYRRRYGSVPPDLSVLVKTGLLASIPVDPYGGIFYLDEEGRIKTTSNYQYRNPVGSPALQGRSKASA